MRELTDRELDAVCGGLLSGINFQNISNTQSKVGVIVSRRSELFPGNVAIRVNRSNGASQRRTSA